MKRNNNTIPKDGEVEENSSQRIIILWQEFRVLKRTQEKPILSHLAKVRFSFLPIPIWVHKC